MPDPTRAQFEAASKKVMASAPPGLSRDEFYALIEKELSPTPTYAVMREKSLAQGAVTDESGQPIESSSVRDLRAAMQGAAHPKTVGDLAPFLIPSTIGGSGPSILKMLSAAKQGVQEGGSIVKAPWNAVKGAAKWANTVPEPQVLGPLNRNWKSVTPQPNVPLGKAPEPHFPKPTDAAIRSKMEDAIAKGMQESHPELPTSMAGPGETVQHDLIPPAHGDPALVAPGEEAAFNATQPIQPLPSHVQTPEPPPNVLAASATNRAIVEGQPGYTGGEVAAKAALEKPKLSGPEVARYLREAHGSEKAGRMLYGKQTGKLDILPSAERTEAIKRLAPGPSQIPAEAKARIDAYLGKGNDISNQYILDALTKRMENK